MPPLWKKNSAFHHNICFEKNPEMQGESIITSFYLKLKIQIETFRGLLRFNVHGGHLDYSIIILCNDNNNILVQHTQPITL